MTLIFKRKGQGSAGVMSKKKVLCVGLVCLDIISLCDGFPKEDSDER